MNKSLLIIIAGPTAVGKTKLAIELAKNFNSSIFSCDSRQFFRELNIGTAKPTENELNEVNHFFINNKSIHDHYSAGDYEKEIISKLSQYFKTNRIAFLVGGSGMYIDAVCNGLDQLPKNIKIRKELNQQFLDQGIEKIQQKLKDLDPNHYLKVDKNNPQRIIRALEVCLITGKPYSSLLLNINKKRNFDCLKFLLHLNNDQLQSNINLRVDKMIDKGLIKEVKNLYDFKNLNALKTVGYKEIYEYLNGQIEKDVAIQKIKLNTKKYSKRQMTWFKKDSDYNWVENNSTENSIRIISNRINDIINGRCNV